jgi:hypothetical protein
MTRNQVDARYIAEQALQAQAAGDTIAAKYLFAQAEAVDPIVAAAVMTRFETSDCAAADLVNRLG